MIRTDISSSSGSYVGSTEYGYDPRGIQTSIINSIGGKTYSQYYHYYQIKNANGVVVNDSLRNAMDGLPTRYIALGVNTDYTHDSLNRRQLTTVDLERDIVTDYNYKMSARTEGTYFTNQLASEEIDGVLYSYTYDKVGNITAIAKGGVAYRDYTYDSLGQLLTEKQYDTKQVISYTYDNLGNIKEKTVNTYLDSALKTLSTTKTYAYEYGDDNKNGWDYLLQGYDFDGSGAIDETEKILYDEIGNPTTYRDATMSWYGRQLTNYSKGSVTASFTYDADGLRGTKTVNGTDTIYQYIGDKLYYEKRGKKQEFYYFYDSYGKLSSIYYHYDSDDDEYDSSAVYFVTTNSQGDVIGLYNNKGVKVAAYEYDAWGNILSVKDSTGETITNQDHIANANPFRYRGYYYDADLKLYYLQSRYYDSTVGRFISGDGYVTTDVSDPLSYNMFAYCINNPVNMSDPSGRFPWVAVLVGIAAIVVTGIDHYLAKNHPDGYSVLPEENHTKTINNANYEQKVAYATGHGASLDKNGATLFDTEIGFYSGIAEFDDGTEFTPFNMLNAKAVAEVDFSGNFSGEIGAIASTASTGFSPVIHFGEVAQLKIEAVYYYGYAGAGIEWDFANADFAVNSPSVGVGIKLGVDFDWK